MAYRFSKIAFFAMTCVGFVQLAACSSADEGAVEQAADEEIMPGAESDALQDDDPTPSASGDEASEDLALDAEDTGAAEDEAGADEAGLAAAPADYSAARGKKLADTAWALHHGHSSGGLCLKGVRQSVLASKIVPNPPGWTPSKPYARAWGVWARQNPAEMKKRKFRQINVSVNSIPQGSIIVWKPGQCGYHRQYGHIEIVRDTASSTACSDYCGKVKKTCGNPLVFMPTK